MLEKSKQIQKAGDNAQQIQAGTVIINQGITEERAREICIEEYKNRANQYANEARIIANERVEQFNSTLIPRIAAIENALNSFSDPSFLNLLVKAQNAASTTDQAADYNLLCELLKYRIRSGKDRITKAGISKAVDIIGEIDDDALCGLTVVHALTTLKPTAGNLTKGLNMIAELFGKIMESPLPEGSEWIDHLDVLGAVRIVNFGSIDSIEQIYERQMPGIVCAGIMKNSEKYQIAQDILSNSKLQSYWLIDNELLDEYVRIPIVDAPKIVNYSIKLGNISVPIVLNDAQVNALKRIWELYEDSRDIKLKVRQSFMEKWNSIETLQQVKQWKDRIPIAFDLTCVGTVLAHANAQRIDSRIPNYQE